MDRFIDQPTHKNDYRWKTLKSNMDRFIVLILKQRAFTMRTLKSNMDRFIDKFKSLFD